MIKTALEKNRAYSEKFIQPLGGFFVPKYLKDIFKNKKIKSILDMGCGDGLFIKSIKKEFPKIQISGIDISPRRINNLKKKIPKESFYIGDVCDTKIKQKFNFIYSSQVIEHVEDDKKMIKEFKRLLKEESILFCSSVIKKKWAIYKYRNNRKFVLDPTHEKEYTNQKEFLELFKEDFKLIKSWIEPVKRKLFGFHIRIPGYSLVFGIWKKRK